MKKRESDKIKSFKKSIGQGSLIARLGFAKPIPSGMRKIKYLIESSTNQGRNRPGKKRMWTVELNSKKKTRRKKRLDGIE